MGVELLDAPEPIEIGRGHILREVTAVALLSFGAHLSECVCAVEELDAMGLSAMVAGARFAQPLDTRLIGKLPGQLRALVAVEQGAKGGYGAHVLHTSPTGARSTASCGSAP